MPPLDPRIDFRDDGGTPGWRARHPQIIDVSPSPPVRRFLLRVAGIPIWRTLLFMLGWLFFVLPLYFVVGLLLFAALNIHGSDGITVVVLYGATGLMLMLQSFRKLLSYSKVR